jgi:hypothetical protein
MEPWGEERADLRAGIVAATIANLFRRKGRTLKPRDFMPKFKRVRKVQTVDEMRKALEVFSTMSKGPKP